MDTSASTSLMMAQPSPLSAAPRPTADAAKALITKSANDISVAIAEHIAGDERRFAELMTRKARELGMNATTFRNPHGLPDREQVTSARDMLTLGLRLYDTFPSYARLFATIMPRLAPPGDGRGEYTAEFHQITRHGQGWRIATLEPQPGTRSRYFNVQVIAGVSDSNRPEFTIYIDAREFSSLEFGERLFQEVAAGPARPGVRSSQAGGEEPPQGLRGAPPVVGGQPAFQLRAPVARLEERAPGLPLHRRPRGRGGDALADQRAPRQRHGDHRQDRQQRHGQPRHGLGVACGQPAQRGEPLADRVRQGAGRRLGPFRERRRGRGPIDALQRLREQRRVGPGDRLAHARGRAASASMAASRSSPSRRPRKSWKKRPSPNAM